MVRGRVAAGKGQIEMKVKNPLAQAFYFTEEDLEANRSGVMSERQKTVPWKKDGTVIILGILAATLYGLIAIAMIGIGIVIDIHSEKVFSVFWSKR